MMQQKQFTLRSFHCVACAVMLVGCNSPNLPSETVPQSKVLNAAESVAIGTVTLDVASLRGFLGDRPNARRLLGFQDSTITHLRLTAVGVDFADVSTIVPIAQQASLSLTVPAGKNRVFKLEAIQDDAAISSPISEAANQAQGNNPRYHTLAELSTLGPVAATGTTTLSINTNTDAAARVLRSIIGTIKGGYSSVTSYSNVYFGSTGFLTVTEQLMTGQFDVSTGITGEELSTLLQSYVATFTGFDAATNQYSVIHPLMFRSESVASLLKSDWNKGLAAVKAKKLLPALTDETRSACNVKVTRNNVGSTGATIRLLDPFSPTSNRSKTVSSIYSTSPPFTAYTTFTDLPPGTWSVKIEVAGTPVPYWRRIEVPEGSIGNFMIDLGATQEAGPLKHSPFYN